MATTGVTPTQTSTTIGHGSSYTTLVLGLALFCFTYLLSSLIIFLVATAMARTKSDQYYRSLSSAGLHDALHVPKYWQCHPVRDAVLATLASKVGLAMGWVYGSFLMHSSPFAEARLCKVISDLLVWECFLIMLQPVLAGALAVANWGHLMVLLWAIKMKKAPEVLPYPFARSSDEKTTVLISLLLLLVGHTECESWKDRSD
ncbi:hypothetical protein LTR91_019413 [Friedmanniomyces endolithicus]|uniref:Uncharacterized protein n=1 Tax=Friedmanniomyces endolithicus TaxID=329885 RepID=A0A4U0TV58_9PEZI|nr:hypothetical protein LTS09_017314 [Friedmanniomyces endolithicus]KAK0271024.1 hypothetical protein LTR35_013822 [Friedmanniomyces endolithicus]KAK0277064.1 hypothetical protein LTS00_014340 [Friedmanniomyces endolithicus]KAK0314067.1 hypothetical protein LTR82_013186 [Friedmanniomyces endolithicus]KAK0962533.1 hypothetical protein LTR91_019413 [Friedmanniomyces endolithicus]